MSKILIFGATSAIAEACARIWANEKNEIVLVARDQAKLDTIAADLKVRGASKTSVKLWDFDSLDGLDRFVDETLAHMGNVEYVLLAHGLLGEDVVEKSNAGALINLMQVNFLSSVVILDRVSAYFSKRSSGQIGVISSVAGDRGRQSNYAYGASKAGLAVFTDGLAHRFAPTPIGVLNIKPGFVDTPMTAAFKKGALWAKPEKVAQKITKAFANNRRGVMYVPSFWRLIMLIIVSVPSRIFWKTKL